MAQNLGMIVTALCIGLDVHCATEGTEGQGRARCAPQPATAQVPSSMDPFYCASDSLVPIQRDTLVSTDIQ